MPSRQCIIIKTAFGFQTLAYAGPETGLRDRASYVMQQDKIRFVLTASLILILKFQSMLISMAMV